MFWPKSRPFTIFDQNQSCISFEQNQYLYIYFFSARYWVSIANFWTWSNLIVFYFKIVIEIKLERFLTKLNFLEFFISINFCHFSTKSDFHEFSSIILLFWHFCARWTPSFTGFFFSQNQFLMIFSNRD